MPPPDPGKVTVVTLGEKKRRGERISAITAYDFLTARIASQAGIDILLIGDSLGMVVQGYPNTLKVTVDDIVYHTAHVSRAKPRSLVVSDMPYHSYHVSVEQSVENAFRCIQEGGAEAVKLEGGRKRAAVIEALLNAEIPVMGHLGLTPQSVHPLGGFGVQGKLKEKAQEIFADALFLEKLGVFAIVLESIPLELAKEISASIAIPTIGIGAGKFCDGQILVFQDLIGWNETPLPKFVRTYADARTLFLKALKEYIADIRSGSFPEDQESFHSTRRNGESKK